MRREVWKVDVMERSESFVSEGWAVFEHWRQEYDRSFGR